MEPLGLLQVQNRLAIQVLGAGSSEELRRFLQAALQELDRLAARAPVRLTRQQAAQEASRAAQEVSRACQQAVQEASRAAGPSTPPRQPPAPPQDAGRETKVPAPPLQPPAPPQDAGRGAEAAEGPAVAPPKVAEGPAAPPQKAALHEVVRTAGARSLRVASRVRFHHMMRDIVLSGCILSGLSREDRRQFRFSSLQNCEESWRGRKLDLSRCGTSKTEDIMARLKAGSRRWKLIGGLRFPKRARPCVSAYGEIGRMFSELKLLEHGAEYPVHCGSLSAMMADLPRLEHIVVPNASFFKLEAVHSLPRLRILDLKECTELHEGGFTMWSRFPTAMPVLEILRVPLGNCWGCCQSSQNHVRTTDACLAPLQSLERLHEFDVSDVQTLTDGALQTLGAFKSLRTLALRKAGTGISSRGLDALAQGAAPLASLDLRGSVQGAYGVQTSITSEDVRAFQERRPGCWVRTS